MKLYDYNCVLCDLASEESCVRLFLACPFTRPCWATLGLIIHHPSDPFGTQVSFKNELQLPFFIVIVVTMCWSIWIVRNNAIVQHAQPSIDHYKAFFQRECAQVT